MLLALTFHDKQDASNFEAAKRSQAALCTVAAKKAGCQGPVSRWEVYGCFDFQHRTTILELNVVTTATTTLSNMVFISTVNVVGVLMAIDMVSIVGITVSAG